MAIEGGRVGREHDVGAAEAVEALECRAQLHRLSGGAILPLHDKARARLELGAEEHLPVIPPAALERLRQHHRVAPVVPVERGFQRMPICGDEIWRHVGRRSESRAPLAARVGHESASEVDFVAAHPARSALHVPAGMFATEDAQLKTLTLANFCSMAK